MTLRRHLLLFCCALVFALVASARTSGSQSAPAIAPVQQGVTVPLLEAPVHLNDFENLQPSPAMAASLAHVSGFIQNHPTDGAVATEQTDVYIGYTRTALYFVFLCHDQHIGQLRSHMSRRENILNDDFISILLDPFHDHRKGVLFRVNPAGVQADAAWDENNGSDYSYDTVWDSEARVTSGGWMALVSIPFRSLRFPAAGGDWGIVLARNLPRNSEMNHWPHMAANVSGMLSQEALLRGIRDVSGSHNFQLNPYTLGQGERTLNETDPANPFFSQRRAEATAGGEAKLILKDSIVLDATVNPDFSDIESDSPQFTINQRYPVYFPELRPFFLENASYFSTPFTLLYSRSIVHPEFGLRMTGKIRHTNVGLLAVDDRQPGEAVGSTDPLYSHRAKLVVGRVSQDLGKGSSVGALYTDYEFGGGFNRIGSVDYTARFNDKWTSAGQFVLSSTLNNVDNGSTYQAGPAGTFNLNRSGHALNFNLNLTDISKGFATTPGFFQSANFREGNFYVHYMWYPKHHLQSIGVETNSDVAFDHDGNRVYHYSSFDPYFTFARGFVFAPVVGQSSDTLGPQNGYAFPASHNFTENNAGIVFRGAPWSQLNFNMQIFRSGNVNYNPAGSGLPFLLDQQTVRAYVTLNPLRQLTVDNTYLLDRNHQAHTGLSVFENQMMRTKMNYQFTRALSARAIVEYNSNLANPATTSLQRTKQLSTQMLLTWLPHPGTAVYAGYNSGLQNIDRSLCYRVAGGGCDPNNTNLPTSPDWLNAGRQIFIKASYLYRF